MSVVTKYCETSFLVKNGYELHPTSDFGDNLGYESWTDYKNYPGGNPTDLGYFDWRQIPFSKGIGQILTL